MYYTIWQAQTLHRPSRDSLKPIYMFIYMFLNIVATPPAFRGKPIP